jgi:hypothetical protein
MDMRICGFAVRTSWADAKQTLQGGVDAQTALGGLVLVTNGTYNAGGAVAPGHDLSNRVAITTPIRMESVGGAEEMTILGEADPASTNGPLAMRCAYLVPGAVLSGFTLTNGHTRAGPDITLDQYAGGALLDRGGQLVECTLAGNSSGLRVGAVAWGTLSDCALIDNAAENGGGAYGSRLNNCTVSGNSADVRGGGVVYGSNPLNANTDGDPMTDGEEVVADTVLTNPASFFTIEAVSSPTPVVVHFLSSSNRVYTLEACGDLATGAWTNLPGRTAVPGNGGLDSLDDTNQPPWGPSYRLRVATP